MPPDDPGAFSDSYLELIECWLNGPENTEGCSWIIPPGGDCDSEILSLDMETIINNFMLNQNYPNPFNPLTKISYGLDMASNVRLSLYDVRGGFVETLINKRINAGTHDFMLDASHLSSGVYFYTMTVNGVSQTRKLILMK